jgi:hypothetical protein
LQEVVVERVGEQGAIAKMKVLRFRWKLLVAERDHGVNMRGAASRNVARQQSDGAHQERPAEECGQVGGTDAKDEIGHDLRQSKRCGEADEQTDGSENHSPSKNEVRPPEPRIQDCSAAFGIRGGYLARSYPSISLSTTRRLLTGKSSSMKESAPMICEKAT